MSGNLNINTIDIDYCICIKNIYDSFIVGEKYRYEKVTIANDKSYKYFIYNINPKNDYDINNILSEDELLEYFISVNKYRASQIDKII